MADNGTAQMTAGLFLIAAGSVVMLGVLSGLVSSLPPVSVAVAMFVMAAGALLAGVSGEDGRPV
jgi:hypothetical protein